MFSHYSHFFRFLLHVPLRSPGHRLSCLFLPTPRRPASEPASHVTALTTLSNLQPADFLVQLNTRRLHSDLLNLSTACSWSLLHPVDDSALKPKLASLSVYARPFNWRRRLWGNLDILRSCRLLSDCASVTSTAEGSIYFCLLSVHQPDLMGWSMEGG